jgi:hypothetical protein
MENFILWSVSFDPKSYELSFFATKVHVQRINQGTQKMIAEMLEDLGCPQVSFETWHVRHFLTNYMTDYPDSDNWQDIWEDTWEVTVKTATPIDVKIEAGELIRTWARDESWQGNSDPILPSECVAVSDFHDSGAATKAEEIINTLEERWEDSPRLEVPEAAAKLLAQIREAYAKLEAVSSPITVRRRVEQPRQLILSLGVFDEAFYASGAKLAQYVLDLCGLLGGTTTWDETRGK